VTEQVLFVPGLISERAARALPQTQNLIRGLEHDFQVEVAHLPGLLNGPAIDPTWQAAADWLAGRLRPGLHLVCSGWISALLLVAVSRAVESPRSLSMGGFIAPPATLRSLQLLELADAAKVAFEMNAVPAGSFEMARMVNPDRESAEVERLSRIVNEDVDWPVYARLMRSYQELDLTVERPHITCPVRYANFKVGLPGFDDMREVVVGLIPHVEVIEMDRWVGQEAGTRIVQFIRRVANEAAVDAT
jgi:hypothetical protein